MKIFEFLRFSLHELFILVIEGIEKSLCLQDSNGHHLLDFRHVLLEDMLVELIDLVVSFLLSGFGHGVELASWTISIQVKRAWVEVNILVQHFLLFIFLELFDEDWSLLINKLLVIDLEISKLFVADGLELLRQNDLFDFFVLI